MQSVYDCSTMRSVGLQVSPKDATWEYEGTHTFQLNKIGVTHDLREPFYFDDFSVSEWNPYTPLGLGKQKDGFIEEDLVLGLFGKKKFLARRRYRRFVLEGLQSGHPGKYDVVKDQRFLGEDSFMDRIEVEKKDGENAVYDIPIEVISQEVSRATGIAQRRLYSLTRSRDGAYGRGMVAYPARTISGCKGTDVSKHFQRNPMRMSQAIIQLENELHKDEPLRKTIEKLKEVLIKKGKKKYFISIA